MTEVKKLTFAKLRQVNKECLNCMVPWAYRGDCNRNLINAQGFNRAYSGNDSQENGGECKGGESENIYKEAFISLDHRYVRNFHFAQVDIKFASAVYGNWVSVCKG